MSSIYDDDYRESSAWVKQHVESSSLGAEWTERARQEKQLLTSALLKMRGRLREEHNKMIKLQQAEAITEEENRLSKRLRDLTREINRADLEILSAMLKAFDVCIKTNGKQTSGRKSMICVAKPMRNQSILRKCLF